MSMRRAQLLVCLLAGACTGAETTIVRPGGVVGGAGGGGGLSAFTVTLNPTTLTLSVGATSQVVATVQDSLGTLLPGVTLTWVSGNAGVASVSPTGLVTGVGAGNTSIGASYAGVAATLAVAVTTVPVASVQVIPATDTLQVGTTLQLTAVPKDANGVPLSGRTIIWSSNNAPVAFVSATGFVNALAPGTATITAVSEGQSATATITVVNVPVVTVTVAPANDTVTVGGNVPLTATPRDSNGTPLTGRVVTWSSSNTGVATVNSGGVVHGVAAGAVTITATSGGQSGTAAITVIVVPVATVQVLPGSATIAVGATQQYTATPRDAIGNALPGRVVTWATSNAGIASVNGTGLVTGAAVGGPVTITATSEGQNGTAAATVALAPPTLVRVILTPDTATINTGTTKQFSVQGKMSDSSLQAISVTYAAAGGTVSQGGLYTAGGSAGTFNVIATATGPKADTSRVTVVQPPPATVVSVTVLPSTANVVVGGTTTLSATPRDSNGTALTGRTITWSSANTAIATVNSSGVVTGVALGGPVTITAATGGQSGTSAITVQVVPVASVQVSPATATIQTGATQQFTATPRDSNGNILTGRTIAWTTSNASLATVNASGLATGVAVGADTITASTGGKSGSAALTVTAPALTLARVIVTPDTVTLLTSGFKQFLASGKMSDSSLQSVSVTWAATGGTITQGGLYGAGVTPGVFRVLATAQGQPKADTSAVSVAAAPPPGTYTTVVGDDWTLYVSDAQLLAAGHFGWGTAGSAGPIDNFVDLVPDATFGQVARITQPLDSTQGYSPQYHRVLPVPLDKSWWRWRIRFSVGWTAVGSGGISLSNAYKVAHMYMPGGGATGRTKVEIENTTNFSIGFGFPGRSYTETLLPGSNYSGQMTTEETDGEWYEFIMYHEKLGPTDGQVRWWKRRLTQNGVIVNNPFMFGGFSEVGVTATDIFPQISSIALGINKNRSNDQTQYIFWGPWELVDGSIYPNPWGVGP